MKEYQGKSDALNFISLSAVAVDRLDVVERMWDVMNRRVVNLYARMQKRVRILKAHVALLEKGNAQKNEYIDKLHQRMGRRDQTIRRQATALNRQSETITRQSEELETLKLELQDAMRRTDSK